MKQTVIIIAIISVVALGSAGANDGSGFKPKSPGTATAMAVMGGMFVPLVGSGIGHSYSGNMGQFYIGLTLRTAGVLLILSDLSDQIFAPQPKLHTEGTVGVILYAGTTIFDIATAGMAANRYNQKHSVARVKVRPTYFASHKAFGVQVSLGF